MVWAVTASALANSDEEAFPALSSKASAVH